MNFPFPLHSPFFTLLVLFPLIPFPALFAHASSLPDYPLPCLFLNPHQFELYFTLLPWQASFYSLYPSPQSAFFSLSSSCILLRYNYHFVFLLSHLVITSLTFFILTLISLPPFFHISTLPLFSPSPLLPCSPPYLVLFNPILHSASLSLFSFVFFPVANNSSVPLSISRSSSNFCMVLIFSL